MSHTRQEYDHLIKLLLIGDSGMALRYMCILQWRLTYPNGPLLHVLIPPPLQGLGKAAFCCVFPTIRFNLASSQPLGKARGVLMWLGGGFMRHRVGADGTHTATFPTCTASTLRSRKSSWTTNQSSCRYGTRLGRNAFARSQAVCHRCTTSRLLAVYTHPPTLQQPTTGAPWASCWCMM